MPKLELTYPGDNLFFIFIRACTICPSQSHPLAACVCPPGVFCFPFFCAAARPLLFLATAQSHSGGGGGLADAGPCHGIPSFLARRYSAANTSPLFSLPSPLPTKQTDHPPSTHQHPPTTPDNSNNNNNNVALLSSIYRSTGVYSPQPRLRFR